MAAFDPKRMFPVHGGEQKVLSSKGQNDCKVAADATFRNRPRKKIALWDEDREGEINTLMASEMAIQPSPGETEEATRHPNGWVYRISKKVGDPNGRVPPEAIVGAWKVNEHGIITGEFVPNPKYDADQWP